MLVPQQVGGTWMHCAAGVAAVLAAVLGLQKLQVHLQVSDAEDSSLYPAQPQDCAALTAPSSLTKL